MFAEVEQYYTNATHERVALLCALASFYAHTVSPGCSCATLCDCLLTRSLTCQGRMERDKAARDSLFDKANQKVVAANKLGPSEQLPWLARGCVALARNNTDEASKSFQQAGERTDGGSENVCPLLGAAACAALRGAHSQALALYSRALRRCPSTAARTGLGVCHLRLGHTQRARQAFARAVAADPTGGGTTAPAHCGLALCAAAEGDVAAAVDSLQSCYAAAGSVGQSRPGSLPLLLLSEHAALAGHPGAADSLAKAAAEVAHAPSLRAAAALQLGRLAHAVGRPEDAHKCYSAALNHVAVPAGGGSAGSPFVAAAARLGLGQVALSRGDLKSGQEHLQQCLHGVSGGASAAGAAQSRGATAHLPAAAAAAAQRALAHAYAAGCTGDVVDAHSRATALLRSLMATGTPVIAGDAGAYVELAGLLQGGNQVEALGVYNEAIAIRAASGHPPHGGLLNNAGSVAAAAGDTSTAVSYFSRALEALRAPPWITALLAETADAASVPSSPSLEGGAAVVAFNLACCLWSAHRTQSAQRLFMALRQHLPSDPSSDLFLARAAAARGDAATCEARALAALAVAPQNLDGHALLIHASLLRGDGKRAQTLAETARKGGIAGDGGAASQPVPHAAGDDHLTVASANALLIDAQHAPPTTSSAESGARRENRLERALALFVKALTKQPRNLAAANGIGCVLAERGRFGEAAAVFSAVVESAMSGNTDAGAAANGAGAVMQVGGDDSAIAAAIATLNAGHCALGAGDAQKACRLYAHVLRKGPLQLRTDPSVLACAARALHEWKADVPPGGGNSVAADAELDRLCTSLQLLRQAVHLAPGNLRLRVDVAFVCQEIGVRSLSRCRDSAPSVHAAESKVALADSAQKHLQLALRLFKQLLAVLPEAGTIAAQGPVGTSSKRLTIHAAFCAETLLKALTARENAVAERDALSALRCAREAQEQTPRSGAAAGTALPLPGQTEAPGDNGASVVVDDAVERIAQATNEKLKSVKEKWAERHATEAAKSGKRKASAAASQREDDGEEQGDEGIAELEDLVPAEDAAVDDKLTAEQPKRRRLRKQSDIAGGLGEDGGDAVDGDADHR